MSPSIWQILVVAVLVLLLFGRGKISGVMGEFAQGIKAFKKGMNEEPETKSVEAADKTIDVTPADEKAADKKDA